MTQQGILGLKPHLNSYFFPFILISHKITLCIIITLISISNFGNPLFRLGDKMVLFKNLSDEQKNIALKKMEELYVKQYDDKKIANEISILLGVDFDKSSVHSWRSRNMLPKVNPKYQKSFAKEVTEIKTQGKNLSRNNEPGSIYATKEKIRFELYNQGYNDREIGRLTNSPSVNIKNWRYRHKLPKNADGMDNTE